MWQHCLLYALVRVAIFVVFSLLLLLLYFIVVFVAVFFTVLIGVVFIGVVVPENYTLAFIATLVGSL